MAQMWRENIWFHKTGEEGINSFVKRIIQRIFFGHHDRTKAISYITESGIARGKSPGNQGTGKFLCQRSHMVTTETRLTKKFITNEEGAGLILPRIVIEKPPEVERWKTLRLV